MMMRRRLLPTPQATIDLHGKTKSEALKRLTSFMDQVSSAKPKSTNVWVLVITGSGAHSNNGPILRTSVESLFQKRKMKYMVNPGKGSFSVDVNSGFQFFEPEQPKDTKVVISETRIQGISSLSKHRDRVRTPPRLDQETNPLPSEVAATDAFLEESWREGQKAMARQQREGFLLEKAMSMSVLEQTKEEEEEEGEVNMLRRAMSLSMIENLPEPRDDENEIQKVLELSKQEFELEQEDDPIQLALELSRKVSCKEDEDLLQILEQSKVQF
jgi:hypothetical protein